MSMLGGKREPLKTDRVNTLIGKETEFKGTIKSSGVLRIDGRLEGEVAHRGDLVVGETGSVTANIRARHVTVAGEIKGNVDAEGRLEILATGRLYGDIRVGHLVIADGAVFQGTSQMKGDSKGGPRDQGTP